MKNLQHWKTFWAHVDREIDSDTNEGMDIIGEICIACEIASGRIPSDYKEFPECD